MRLAHVLPMQPKEISKLGRVLPLSLKNMARRLPRPIKDFVRRKLNERGFYDLGDGRVLNERGFYDIRASAKSQLSMSSRSGPSPFRSARDCRRKRM